MLMTIEYKKTGLAIFSSTIIAIFFYIIYRALFTFIVSIYSIYNPSFGNGIGALILIVLGSNIFSFLSASACVKKIFPLANMDGIFYGLASLLVFMLLISIMFELNKNDYSLLVILIQCLVVGLTIYAIRFPLTNNISSES
jgi:hypothetical protein